MRTHSALLRTLWSGWALSVLLVLIASSVVAAIPHARGIAFPPALRYAVVAPVCIAIGLATAFLFPIVRAPRSRAGAVAVVFFGGLELVALIAALASERPASIDPIPRATFDVEHKFVDLPSGARIHYVDEGHGQTLLFLHGNPSWSYQWRDLIRGLRSSYRCVALDYPGFGLSQAPSKFGYTPLEESRIVEEFVDRLQLEDITLVMQDWGGPIGIGFAERRPDLVRRVILGSTWAWQTRRGEPRGVWSTIAGGPVGEFLQVNFNAIPSVAIKDGVVRELPRDVAEGYKRPFEPSGRRGIAAFYPGQIMAASQYFGNLEAGLPRLSDKKALIFWAMNDPGFPDRDLARWERAFPDHRTIKLAGARHFFFEDTSDQMISEIRAFMPPAHALPLR